MPSKATSSASAWQGAPPVVRDGFAFGNGVFFADASGSRHARASVSELHQHFKSGNANDHPAHWFEAQLLHYDLKPSKTKSVARMRLLDAVNGGLAIPGRISKLEDEMKKEWTKLDREAKKAAQAVPATTTKAKPEAKTTATPKPKATPAKRKSSEPAASQSAPKRPKAEPASPVTNSRSLGPGMARRGGIHQSPGRASSPRPVDSYTSVAPMPRQMARRSRPFHSQGRIPSLPRDHYGEFEYGYDEQDAGEGYKTDPYDRKDDGGPPDSGRLGPLGLLNGGYDIRSETVEREWSCLSDDLSLVLTLAGSEMWGMFDLGIVEGIMHFRSRPGTSSFEGVPFTWRGRENEGHIICGNHNRGWAQFLGDGRIEGELEYMSIKFSGQRHPGQGTRSQVDTYRMRSDWNGYSERQYDEENVRRWG